MPAEIKEEDRTVPGMDADKDIPITQELEARHGSEDLSKGAGLPWVGGTVSLR